MPVEPVPCAPTGGGGEPVEVTTCCSPSTTSTALCRADGSTILMLVQSTCAECGTGAGDPVLVGWFDLATGILTAGPAPADATPCDAGCVETVCRTLCDDTDGDGAADATYSELWCIRADGSAELVLTYQDNPAVPYTPTAPVECEYGCPQTETVQLCDDSGMFLRRYTWLQGVASYEDFALDGVTPYVVKGTIGACAGGAGEPPCAEPTTPAATLGLCLPDGTPLAVVITRDCATGAVTQDGWLNLTTGTYTSGPPPVGAAACGDLRAFELAGLLCDVDPATGNVLGLVLVEYEYNPDGSLGSVRLVDPATGATYTLQGELRHCPASAGAEQPEQDLTVLCDTAADGTITAFVRDYRRDPASGEISGHTDYTLDGQPYTPAGTVGTCSPAAEPCRNTSTVLLCDADGATRTVTPTVTDGTVAETGYAGNAAFPPLAGSWTPLWTGGSLVFPADADGTAGDGVQAYRTVVGHVVGDVPENCATATGDVTLSVRVTLDGPNPGVGGDGWLRVWRDGVQLASAGVQASAPVGHVQTLTVTVPATPDDLATGRLVFALSLETFHGHSRSWTADQFSVSAALDGCAVQFLRNVTVDCETGQVTSVVDTTLDGLPYTVTGEVGQCATAGGGQVGPPEPCRDSTTLLVCDLPTGGTPEATVTDTDPTPYYPYPTAAPVAGAQTLWDGGTLDLPPGTAPQPGTTGSVNSLAAGIQAPRPACDTGTARVTVSLNVQQTGPDDGCGQVGHLRIFNGTTQVGLTVLPANTPAGFFGTLIVEADVPAADLAAGTVAFALALDAFDDNPTACTPSPRRTGWQLSNFTVTAAYDQAGCATQILRTVLTDCDTGTVLAVTDTTMDGQPYTVTGEVGQCTSSGSGQCCPADPCPAQSVLPECRCDDTDGDGAPDRDYVELLAVDCTGTLTSLGTYTADLSAPYTPVSPVPCGDGDGGVKPTFGVQARRVELAAGASWDAAAWPTLQSVTAVAHGGTGTITTADGTSTLHQGEAATWSTARDEDAALRGPLTIAASSGTGTVTVSFTIGVQL